MFKTRPIRNNCPVCEAKFSLPIDLTQEEDSPEEKGSKKKGKKSKNENPDTSIADLYQMKIRPTDIDKIMQNECFNQDP